MDVHRDSPQTECLWRRITSKGIENNCFWIKNKTRQNTIKLEFVFLLTENRRIQEVLINENKQRKSAFHRGWSKILDKHRSSLSPPPTSQEKSGFTGFDTVMCTFWQHTAGYYSADKRDSKEQGYGIFTTNILKTEKKS